MNDERWCRTFQRNKPGLVMERKMMERVIIGRGHKMRTPSCGVTTSA